MTPSRQPVVWVTAILGLLAAAATAGLIQQDDVDRYGPLVELGVPFAFLVVSTVLGLWTRTRTAPVGPDTPAAPRLVRGFDGVYRTTADDSRHRLVEQAEAKPPPGS